MTVLVVFTAACLAGGTGLACWVGRDYRREGREIEAEQAREHDGEGEQ